MTVVLLSTSKDRVDAIRAASRRKGFACTVVQDDARASEAMQRSRDTGILVVDSEATGDLQGMLKARSPNWPILVLAAQFDSSEWVELFKAGASEIVGEPLHARKLDAALDGFIRQNPQASRGWWDGLARRLGMR